jgi:hypothetical protein
VQSALASTLASLGDSELFPDPSVSEYQRARLSHEVFEEAVAAARAGIGEAQRLKMKDQLAFLQSALAGALIGIANEETTYNRDAAAADHLREAAAAAKAALAIQTPDKNGESWADTEAMFAEAMSRIDRNPSELQAAIAAYQASMRLQTRDRDPQNWSADENGIATALENLGLLGSGAESLTYLGQAAAIQRELLAGANPETDSGNWYVSETNLARIETEMGDREPDGADLRLAAADYRELLRYVSPAASPGAWRDLNQQVGAVIAEMRGAAESRDETGVAGEGRLTGQRCVGRRFAYRGRSASVVGLAQLDIEVGLRHRTRIQAHRGVVGKACTQFPLGVFVVLDGGVADFDLANVERAVAEQEEHAQVLVEAGQLAVGAGRVLRKDAPLAISSRDSFVHHEDAAKAWIRGSSPRMTIWRYAAQGRNRRTRPLIKPANDESALSDRCSGQANRRGRCACESRPNVCDAWPERREGFSSALRPSPSALPSSPRLIVPLRFRHARV